MGASLESSHAGSPSFSMYALPDPPEAQQHWFSETMLVPILIGMDFMSKVGLILDFADGHAVFANTKDPSAFFLQKNMKGHYMIDIIQYMTGTSALEAASQVQRSPEASPKAAYAAQAGYLENQWGETESFELATLESTPKQFHESQDHPSRTASSFFGALFQDVSPCSTLFWMFQPHRVLKILFDRSSPRMASPNSRAKGAKSKSLTAPPFDYEKETGVSKDDLCSETQWPCYGKHIESPQSSNRFAGWKSYVVRGVRDVA